MERTPQTQRKLNAIICPNCHQHNIAFVTEYHKSISCRVLETILMLLIFVMATINFSALISNTLSDENMIPLIIFPVGLFLLKAGRQVIESKTHIQCICKDCGEVWLHN